MIRYDYDSAAVSAAIAAIDKNWAKKAWNWTDALIVGGSFPSNAPALWSDVKPVFMDLQHNKCIYCERQFSNRDYGTIEWDLEHFRPKSTVAAWPDASRHPDLHYGFATGASSGGYYWLAYNLQNYAASCKVCNSTFKHIFFPVAKPRGTVAADPIALLAEEPYICLPLGADDDDPEELITFVVTSAIPAAKSGRRRERGEVIIDFFGLNKRDELHRERARMIGTFGSFLKALADGHAGPTEEALIARIDDPAIPHANCVRAFRRLWQDDEPLARRAHELCLLFGFSDEGTAPPRL